MELKLRLYRFITISILSYRLDRLDWIPTYARPLTEGHAIPVWVVTGSSLVGGKGKMVRHIRTRIDTALAKVK